MMTHVTADDLDRVPGLRDALLALNNDHAQELSWVDAARLTQLIGEAFFARRAGFSDALLIAFDQGADYDSPNFLWFRDRYDRFVYVDRVVTAAAARGRGLARALYLALIAAARAAGHERIVCEVNRDPPNPASDAFHRSMGFVGVGSAELGNGKVVGYLELVVWDWGWRDGC
jgi:predicted GNAT superfamily acetyltransferase